MLQTSLPTTSVKMLRSGAKAVAGGVLLSLLGGAAAAADFRAEYLYDLATFTGNFRFDGARVAADGKTGETYVWDGRQRSVIVFNPRGMEVYRFGDENGMGAVVVDLAVEEAGTVLLLSYFYDEDSALRFRLVRCDYRVQPLEELALKGLPEDMAGFMPSRITLRNGKIYLASDTAMTAVSTDRGGKVLETWNLGKLLKLNDQQVVDSGLGGFAVDGAGALLFTSPVYGAAYRVSPNGELQTFGKRGSGPGKFGVPKGLAVDAKGYIYVVDVLRARVLAFDGKFDFVTEFGPKGQGLGGLRAPQDLAVAPDGKVYVSQMARKGISVYQVGSLN